MRISKAFLTRSVLGLSLALLVGGSSILPRSAAYALDADAVISPDATPMELFSQGFRAYKRGEKQEASEVLRYAAEKGHAGARWKLGQMYASGDGIPEDDFEAFKIFESIVREQDYSAGLSVNAAYVASAVVALADYLKRGIPNSPVTADPVRARQFYFHAASVYGNPKAQFEYARMLLEGEGGRKDARQAARWLKLASAKGHAGAQALLGYLLFDGERISHRPEPVRALILLTTALKHASPSDQEWIRSLQEEVYSLASEADRQMAMAQIDSEMATASQ